MAKIMMMMPREKTPLKASFWRRGSWRLRNKGIGRSITEQMIRLGLYSHVCEVRGSQVKWVEVSVG
jgi:hypothetical protein